MFRHSNSSSAPSDPAEIVLPSREPSMASWRWAFRCLFKSMVREHEVLEKVVAAEEAEKDERGLRRAFGETDVAAAGWGVEATAQQMYAGRPRAQPPLSRALCSRVLRFAHRPSLSSKSHRGRHDWMAYEDRRRDELFEKPLPPAPRRPSSRAIPPGAHASFQLARKACRRVYCCGACGAWLARCQDVLPVAERVCDMSLDDCAVTVCVASADVRNARKREIGAGGGWTYAANDVRCLSCDAFLGLRLNSMRRNRGAFSTAAHAALLEALLGDAQGVRVSSPRLSSSAYVSWRRQQEGGSVNAVSGVFDETSSGSRSEITSSGDARSGASSSRGSVSQHPSPTLPLREEGDGDGDGVHDVAVNDSDGDGAHIADLSSARGGAAAAAAVIAAAAGFGEGSLWGSGPVSTPHAPAVAPLPPAPLAVQYAPPLPFASDEVRVDQVSSRLYSAGASVGACECSPRRYPFPTDTARHALPPSARYAHEPAGRASCAAALPAVRAHALVHRPAALHATALGVWPHDAAAGVLRQLGRELERRGAFSVRGASGAGHDAHGGRLLSVRLPSRLQVLRRPHAHATQPQPSRTVRPCLLHVCSRPLPDRLPTRRQHLMRDAIRRTQGRDQAPLCDRLPSRRQ